NQIRTTVVSGEVWIEPAAPTRAIPLTLSNATRLLMVENTYGTGTVDVMLSSASGSIPAVTPLTLTFRDARISYQRTPIEVAELPAGAYQLITTLSSGSGGRVGYALIESNPILAPILAVLVGISAGLVVALATAAFTSVLTVRE
ncbi:MAG TPA: hypothetical protein PKC19_21395, partial [Roseiflexaceae bacterium]|nr:hypothetical protein [Roseiflexaceae bacterium]